MKKAQSVGLIGTGSLTDSPLTRFWWLSERLGPVKSASYRVASRIANMLQAGHPVKDYADFESCALILVCVPEETVARVVLEMASAGISWKGKAVVLCSTWLDSGELRELSARGAAVGSIAPIPGFDDERYVVEGDPLAIRQAKSLVEYRGRRAVAIERPLKPFYLAALTCTGTLLFALLQVAFEALRYARISPGLSATLLERQMTRTLRSFLKGGRRAYPVPRELPRQLRALSAGNPELAHYLEQSCHLASQLMEKQRAV
ncbi:MAG TPA: hypothetical protein VK686_20560 [Bryobacteraceae bacterium]|nr:hypothetical protein [Bryobacteraceae bacterium]